MCALSTDHADTLCRVQIFVLREFYTFLSHAVATMIHGCISLSSWCLLMVVCLFLAVPWGCLLFVIVVFPDHAHILFLGSEYPLNLLYMNTRLVTLKHGLHHWIVSEYELAHPVHFLCLLYSKKIN